MLTQPMQTKQPPFYLLDGALGWRTGSSQGLSLGVETGLRLAADPTGPLALGESSGSLGGLVLPRGMALDDEGTLYLLEHQPPWQVKRYRPASGSFHPLPGIGGYGVHPRQFKDPRGIAVAGRRLWVVEADSARVQVFALDGLALRQAWSAEGPRRGWQPVDVAAGSGWVYVLDASGWVYRAGERGERITRHLHLPKGGQWQRIAVDRAGKIYLLDTAGAAPRLVIFTADGQPKGTAADAGDVRGRFAAPPLRLMVDLRRPNSLPSFCLPAGLTRECERASPDEGPAPEVPLGLCAPWSKEAPGQLFDMNGDPVTIDPAELIEPLVYGQQGVWVSQALNSSRFRCQWHRVELDFARIPPGCRVVVSTLSADNELAIQKAGSLDPSAPQWTVGFTASGVMQPPKDPSSSKLASRTKAAHAAEVHTDFLVQSRQGQFLWIKIELFGDGFDTPALQAMRIHFPRESYLADLPAVYSSDEESRWYLDRFLSIFQTEWEALEQKIEDSAGLFDPEAVPEQGGFLRQLAAWLALPMEGTWSGEQQRNLLRAVPQVYPRRGTPAGLRAYLQAYLQSMTGWSPAEQGDLPQLVESFRLRKRLMFDSSGSANDVLSPAGSPLWSPGVVGRLQAGAFARAGEVRLISTADPQRDLFHQHAHHFRVVVPAVWVSSADDERMLRRALDAEKPAHAAYDLCLVEPRFRIGIQSTVGLDTIIGTVPTARLTCPAEQDQAAPSRPLHSRLGYDTVLGGRGEAPGGLPLPVGSMIR
jgi:phage tail-like protein